MMPAEEERAKREAQSQGAGAETRPRVLVLAARAEVRADVATLLEPIFATQGASCDELAKPARLLDAQAAVVVVDGADLDALRGIRELPAGAALVLLVSGTDEALLERAVDSLRPAALLPHPVAGPALRLALERCVPAHAGGGARPQHRRASALLGVSSAIREIIEQVRQIAPSDLSVLILGETGTGKELVARAIHEESRRRRKPFVTVNCSALPDTLLEAELFGARKGAFTGADRDRHGLFAEAEGGTLFLDEVGDTSPALQAKLLRVLETGEYRPLGDSTSLRSNVRIVSATHRDLQAAIANKRFRSDLFYRLNTVTIEVPPLRRRRVDVPFLAQHFAEEFGEAQARRIVLSEDFLEALAEYDFPGNVRELRNAVERSLALTRSGEPVTASHFAPAPASVAGSLAPFGSGTLRERIERLEREAIQDALQESGGNRTRAAEALGLSRLGLRKKMRRLGLEEASGR